MSTKFCGLRSSTTIANATIYKPLRPHAVKLRKADEPKTPPSAKPIPVVGLKISYSNSPPNKFEAKNTNYHNRTRYRRYSNERRDRDLRILETSRKKDFEWAREDQLSVILEILESEAGSRKNTPNWSEREKQGDFPLENLYPLISKRRRFELGRDRKSVV